jgi:monoamine oxidase
MEPDAVDVADVDVDRVDLGRLDPDKVDVIVVGAGFAGLSAARALLDRGCSVRVLEARAAVGGRVRAFVAGDGTRRDAGGQFICDDMPEVTALVRSFGLQTVETLWQRPPVSVPAGHAAQPRAGHRASRLFEEMDAADPDDPAIAGLSIAGWLDKQDASGEARGQFLSMVHGLWCRPADEIPFWYLIDSDRRNTARVSELQYFLKDSAAGLAEAMAGTLGQHLHLAMPVSRIVPDEAQMMVEAGGERFYARHVLVAVPPVRTRDIVRDMPLPPDLRAALDAWRSGAVVKMLVCYPRRIWPDTLSSGLSFNDVSGLFAFDVSLSDDCAAFVVFIGGPLALDWRRHGADWMRSEVERRLGDVLGDSAGPPDEVILHDWTDDRWSGGGYSDVIVNGSARDAEDVLRAGMPGLSFACSELSPSFPSYIEGAIVAGRIAATRIVAELGTA